jgi:hypothetical protein
MNPLTTPPPPTIRRISTRSSAGPLAGSPSLQALVVDPLPRRSADEERRWHAHREAWQPPRPTLGTEEDQRRPANVLGPRLDRIISHVICNTVATRLEGPVRPPARSPTASAATGPASVRTPTRCTLVVSHDLQSHLAPPRGAAVTARASPTSKVWPACRCLDPQCRHPLARPASSPPPPPPGSSWSARRRAAVRVEHSPRCLAPGLLRMYRCPVSPGAIGQRGVCVAPGLKVDQHLGVDLGSVGRSS